MSTIEEDLKIDKSTLLGKWRSVAYSTEGDRKELEKLWQGYFLLEKGIYSQLLEEPETVVRGTVKELAEKYDVPLEIMVGFLDGINDSLKEPNPIETMTEDTEVNLGFDTRKLYMNMVDARADWLFKLPQWNKIYTKEEQRAMYLEQKQSGTIVKEKEPGRNDPCPCGSGKKYKHCCGKK